MIPDIPTAEVPEADTPARPMATQNESTVPIKDEIGMSHLFHFPPRYFDITGLNTKAVAAPPTNTSADHQTFSRIEARIMSMTAFCMQRCTLDH